MSDNLERILLTNVPEFVDEWELKTTTPCGDLIYQVSKYPSDLSKAVVLTKGQCNARKIATALDNYKLFGTPIQALYASMKPTDASNATNCYTVVADCTKNHEIQANIQVKPAEEILEEHTSPDSQRMELADNAYENGNQDRKRRSSATVDSTEAMKHARREETGESLLKVSSRRSPSREDSQVQKVLPDSRQNEDSSRKSKRCRFCRQSGHATWDCKKKAEYNKVAWTIKGAHPSGCKWPESSIVKVEGLHAGPVIGYIEKCHLQKYKMNREEIRIMFAWVTGNEICYHCGAAGHYDTEGLCNYLRLDRSVTVEETAHLRRPFCKRLKGISNKMSLGKIQQHARRENQEFRDRKETSSDRRPLKCSEKMDEEQTEKPQRGTLEEPEPTGKHNPPVEPRPIVFSPPIKTEPPEEHDQDEDDGESVMPHDRSGRLDTPGTSKLIRRTWARK